MFPTKVAIILSQGWGWGKPEDYDKLAEQFRDALAEEKDSEGSKIAEPLILQTADEALPWLNGRGTIVFLSRGDIAVAKKIASEHPEMRVVLYTGALPPGEVIYIGKAWGSRQLLVQATLRG